MKTVALLWVNVPLCFFKKKQYFCSHSKNSWHTVSKLWTCSKTGLLSEFDLSWILETSNEPHDFSSAFYSEVARPSIVPSFLLDDKLISTLYMSRNLEEVTYFQFSMKYATNLPKTSETIPCFQSKLGSW